MIRLIKWLFGFDRKDIEVTIHRQSVIHSMIRTKEGAIYAQLSPPDMTLPIMAAIADKKLELKDIVRPLSFDNLTLTFEKPDLDKFKMLALAFDALNKKGSYPIAYNAANEFAVAEFIKGTISFNDIPKITEYVMSFDFIKPSMDFDSVIVNDRRARELAKEALCNL